MAAAIIVRPRSLAHRRAARSPGPMRPLPGASPEATDRASRPASSLAEWCRCYTRSRHTVQTRGAGASRFAVRCPRACEASSTHLRSPSGLFLAGPFFAGLFFATVVRLPVAFLVFFAGRRNARFRPIGPSACPDLRHVPLELADHRHQGPDERAAVPWHLS